MIKSLELWNFKRVEHSLNNFELGLTALKGANEAGKSSRYQAIAYALFGARSLPLSLAETVTWGKPESSLKVRLIFDYAGNEYTVQRNKAGAELFCKALNLLVSGQSEVTKYVEGLFGVNADTASKLTVASQNELRGALEGKAAVPLIEKLANISMIDTLISKVQERLPSGSTKALEAALEACSGLQEPVTDFSELQLAIASSEMQLKTLNYTLLSQQGRLKALESVHSNLASTLPAIYTHNSKVQSLRNSVTKLKASLAKPLPTVTIDLAEVERLHKEQEGLIEAKLAYIVFSSYTPIETATYTGQDLGTDVLELESGIKKHTTDLAKVEGDLRVAAIGRINENQCSLCGKLLQDVPEVVAKNIEVDAKVASIQLNIKARKLQLADMNEQLLRLKAIAAEVSKVQQVLAKTGKYVIASEGVPPKLTWGGGIVSSETVSYLSDIVEAKRQQAAVAVATAQREADVIALGAAQRELEVLGAEKSTTHVQEAELALSEQRKGVGACQVDAHLAEQTLTRLQARLASAEAAHLAEVKAYEAAQLQVAMLKSSIKEYESNNTLMKRLREVRPIVAAHLWSVVLTSVSRYFSQIRGVQSIVTVGNGSFLVDNKPAEAYSGSTLDSLGLAIRMALSKTFLPNLDFLLLDEPAAGMDDEREAAMLGVLAAANYKQVVVVTHSALADSFANNVIQL